MFPELFKIPYINFTINTYGVLIAIAFLAGSLLAAKLGERDGLDKGKIYDLCMYMLIASLIGSRLLLLITEWDNFFANPSASYLDFLRSAGVFYGGLIGAILASVFLMNSYKLPWWKTADACAPGIALGQFFGRLGCFSAGCCWGKPTTSWLGVHFTERAHELTDVPIFSALHPTQLYESAATLILCFLLLNLRKYRTFNGQIILTYLLSYSIIRFSIEFLRDDPRGSLWIFSTSQIISLLSATASVVGFFYLRNLWINREIETQGV